MNKTLLPRKNNWTLRLIIIAAFLIRFWSVGSTPPALTPDEASLGYNAYSIIKTGKDEFGVQMPLVFKSFGDYKPGLYVYLAAPFVAILGLNEFSVRLPSVIAGTVTAYLIYLITRYWFPNKKGLALIASLVAAVNPFLIYFSRGAWESNVSLMLTLAGIYFFLKSLSNGKYLIYSGFIFGLTLLTYQGAKFSSSLTLALLLIIYFKEFIKIKKHFILLSIIIGLVVSLPVIVSVFNGEVKRLAIFSVFSYPRPDSELGIYAGPLFDIFHSNSLNYLRMIMSRWFNFYSGQFLFFAGDIANPVHTPPYQGVMLLVDLLLLPIGFFKLLNEKLGKPEKFILLWFTFAPLSAAMSRDQTNAVRSLPAAIPLVIIVSIGLWYITVWRREKVFKLLKLTLMPLYVFSIIYFYDAYFIHLPKHNSLFWRYGYKEAVSLIASDYKDYKDVYFEQSFNQPYIYFLFYNQYNPAKWQSQAKLADSEYKGDVGYQTGLDNIHFEKPDWSKFKNVKDAIVVASPASVPPEVITDKKHYTVLNEVKYLDKTTTAFLFIRIN